MEQIEDGFGGAQLKKCRLRQERLLSRKGMKVPDEIPEDGFPICTVRRE